MECPYMRWQDEYRTFSDNIPGYAQGAVFPGDEGGVFCKQTGDPCPVAETGHIWDCDLAKPTELLCPSCLMGSEYKSQLVRLDEGGLICPACEERYDDDDMICACNENMEVFFDRWLNLIRENGKSAA